jgi:hypothetical protein
MPPPFYRDPAGVLVLANASGLVISDLTFVDADSPLPVVADTLDPDMVRRTPPFYLLPTGIRVLAEGWAIVLSDGTIVGPGNPLPVTGGGGGGDAYSVTYTNPAYPDIMNVGEALDLILYVAVDITAMTGGSSNEIGSSVASVNLNWVINKDVTSQSISNGVGTIDPDLRTLLVNGPFTSNQTWQLTASDGESSDNASTSLSFFRKRYWGVSPETSLDNSEILALSQEFATNNDKAITYDCTGGRYPYFCYPTSFGALTSVTVGGLAFSDYTQDVQSFTNASGHTENYYVTRFNGIQTGAAINVVWS